MARFVFFDGVHGVGKTTLVKSLSELLSVQSIVNIDLPDGLTGDPFHDQLVRNHFFHDKLHSYSGLNGLVLVDRSPLSLLVYSYVNRLYGLLSYEQFAYLFRDFELLFNDVSGYKVLLVTDESVLMSNIVKRGRKGFNEFDVDYLKMVINGFNYFSDYFDAVIDFSDYDSLLVKSNSLLINLLN